MEVSEGMGVELRGWMGENPIKVGNKISCVGCFEWKHWAEFHSTKTYDFRKAMNMIWIYDFCRDCYDKERSRLDQRT